MAARLIRDVGRVLGYSYRNRVIAKWVPMELNITLGVRCK